MEKQNNSKVLIAAAVTAIILAGGGYLYFAGVFDFIPEKNVEQEAEYKLFTGDENEMQIRLYYGDAESVGFRGVPHKIAETAEQINRVKQAIDALLKNPLPESCIRAWPDGMQMREVYLDSYGILYIDLPQSITAEFQGGSTSEYIAVYSVIHTVFQNFNFVRGIRFLIDGKEAETIAGHIDISGVIRP